MTFLRGAFPGLVGLAAVLEFLGPIATTLGVLQLLDLADEGCGGRVAGAGGRGGALGRRRGVRALPVGVEVIRDYFDFVVDSRPRPIGPL